MLRTSQTRRIAAVLAAALAISGGDAFAGRGGGFRGGGGMGGFRGGMGMGGFRGGGMSMGGFRGYGGMGMGGYRGYGGMGMGGYRGYGGMGMGGYGRMGGYHPSGYRSAGYGVSRSAGYTGNRAGGYGGYRPGGFTGYHPAAGYRPEARFPNVADRPGGIGGAGWNNGGRVNAWRNGYDRGYNNGWINGRWNDHWHGWGGWGGWGWGLGSLYATDALLGWGWGSPYYSWGYSTYTNPYYVAQPIVIQGGSDPAASTASYNYSQPIDTATPPPPEDVAAPAEGSVEAARESFKTGDYPFALQTANTALKTLPNDAALHELIALILFAEGKYDQAAVPLYAALSVGPGWDWTTMVGLYPSVDTYTTQLRALEDYCVKNPKSASAHFVLAYHYMTQGHTDAAAKEFRIVAKLQPNDRLSAALAKQLSQKPPADGDPAPPPAAAPAFQPKSTSLVGTWKASPGSGRTITLAVTQDGKFNWTAAGQGQNAQIEGRESSGNGLLTLAGDNNKGVLTGTVTWLDDNRFTFKLEGGGPDDPGLTFSR